MKDEELTCALRALTLCDGQEAATVSPRAVGVRCYCAALADVGLVDELERQRTRIERARVVARSSEVQRLMEQRQRWLSTPPF